MTKKHSRILLGLSSLTIVLIASFYSFRSYAIKGSYLPESELPLGVCKMMVGLVDTVLTPDLIDGQPNPRPAFHDISENVMMCSANLIGPQTVLTAGHCFVGNNEQLIEAGQTLYPKLTVDANGASHLLPGCTYENWRKKPSCIDSVQNVRVVSYWKDIRLECATSKNQSDPQTKYEVRKIDESSGYPHPMFKMDNLPESVSHRNFDVTVWRFDQPITNIPYLVPEFNDAEQMKVLQQNANSCRSFGFGLDNDDNAGTYRGTYTPIRKADQGILYSDTSFDPNAEGDSSVFTGRTDHGDSGGALICKNLQGQDKLFGIVSRGGPSQEASDSTPFGNVIDTSVFTKISYVTPWIQKVLKEAPLHHPQDPNWWHQFVLPTETDLINRSLQQYSQCIQTYRQRMEPDAYQLHKTQLAVLNDTYKKALQEDRRYGHDAGFLRTRVREVFKKSQGALFTCIKENQY